MDDLSNCSSCSFNFRQGDVRIRCNKHQKADFSDDQKGAIQNQIDDRKGNDEN